MVLKKLKLALLLEVLANEIDVMALTIVDLTQNLGIKEGRIATLEKKVNELEFQCDSMKQYSRRSNLRFHCIPETGEGER